MIVWQRVWELDDLINSDDRDWDVLVAQLANSEELHYVILEHNWNDLDGFVLPNLVLSSPECDRGTLLMMFEMIGEDPDCKPRDDYEEREKNLEQFTKRLRAKWVKNDYPENISYNGSPGKAFEREWKARHTHQDMYPDEN